MEIKKLLEFFGLFSTKLANMLKKAVRKIKNPMQLKVTVQHKTFIVESAISASFKENPLGIYDETFSRYIFYVLQDGKQARMNVPLEGNNIPDVIMKREGETVKEKEEGGNVITMLLRSVYAYIRHIHLLNTPTKDEGNGAADKGKIAYETRFKAGHLKDRTPAEILLEDDDGEKKLRTQREFLADNLKKYPRNKGLIDAIDMALKLAEEGSLEKGAPSAASAGAVIKLFSVGLRPLQRKRRADGKCFVYTGHVNWRLGEENPVEVEIENFYAPVEKRENGTLRVLAAKKDPKSYIKGVFNLPASLWISYVYRIAMDMRLFENNNGLMARLLAESTDAYQRQAWETEE